MIVRRGALTDHYVEDERSVVMVDESVLGLSPVATAILEAVPEGTDVRLTTVTQHVVATFGPPAGAESAEALTEQQIWDLVAHRVLIVVEDKGSRDGTSRPFEDRVHSTDDAPESAVTALRDALRHLRSDGDDRWASPDSLSPDGLVTAARQHHVIPYLAANLHRLDIPGQARSELDALAGRQRAGAAVLLDDAVRALAALETVGVRALLFKGLALAAQAYGDYTLRGAGDVDLLVAPEDLERAHQALTEAGWVPAPGYPVPGATWAWRHLRRTGNELTLRSAGSEIDLHWHLMPTSETFPRFDVLWSRRDVVVLAGNAVPTLSLYDALTHSAGHAAKDEWRWMRSLLDVHLLAANGDAWIRADRPLRADQFLTVGLALRQFGLPPGMPPIATDALYSVSESMLRRVWAVQEGTAPEHRPLFPGLNLLHRLRTVKLTGGSLGQSAKLVSKSVLPPWITAEIDSRFGVVAVPKALARRAGELTTSVKRRSALLGVTSGESVDDAARRAR